MSPIEDKTPNFYAEYLPNIKSVTLTLNQSPGSSYGLHPDGTLLRITTPVGKTIDIPLPARCNANGEGMRISQDLRDPSITVIRLPAKPLISPSSSSTDHEDYIAPWSATQLNGTEVEVRCKSCSDVIVSKGSVKVWKDLPSEGWAEMMDLWHCHKPDEHHLPGHEHEQVTGKGYAAGSKLIARRGTGFVDALSFLLQEDDCVGVEQLDKPPVHDEAATRRTSQDLLCKHCQTPVGTVDDQSEGYKLYKPYLALCFSPLDPPSHLPNPPLSVPTSLQTSQASADYLSPLESLATSHMATENSATSSKAHSEMKMNESGTKRRDQHLQKRQAFETEKWLSAYLLALISSTGVRKFRLKSDRGEQRSRRAEERELWVFSSSLTYTSSLAGGKPVEAMKVFYRTLSALTGVGDEDGTRNMPGSESLRKENLMMEEIRLPPTLETALWEMMTRSTNILPAGPGGVGGARSFEQWDVGLLARFTADDLL